MIYPTLAIAILALVFATIALVPPVTPVTRIIVDIPPYLSEIPPSQASETWWNPRFDRRGPDDVWISGRHSYTTRDLMGRKL